MKYSIVQVRKMVEQLQEWIDAATDMMDADNVSEARADLLDNRISALQEALDALEGIE